MNNKHLKKDQFNVLFNMQINWYVTTKKQSIKFTNFLEALEFYNRSKKAVLFSTEEISNIKK